MDKVRFVNVVWGRDFTDAFLRVALPSCLSAENVPFFSRHTESEYWIYTTRRDAKVIQRSRAYSQLSSLMRVRMVFISGLGRTGKYDAMNQCHRHFIQQAATDTCALSFQSPDIVWADGSFRRLLELFKSGWKNIAIGSTRAAKETFLPALLQQYGDQGVLKSITPRQLVRLALDHLHPVTQAQMWTSGNHFSFSQGELFWPVDREGLVIRRFQLQPLLVTPDERTVLPTVTVDYDYTSRISSDANKWYIVRDSDEMCYVDFTSSDYGREYGGRIQQSAPSVRAEAEWASTRVYWIHKIFVKSTLRFHSDDCSSKWEFVERQSDVVIDDILSALEANQQTQVERGISKTRYVTPTFVLGQLKEKGVAALSRETWSRGQRAFLRRAFGPAIDIAVQ